MYIYDYPIQEDNFQSETLMCLIVFSEEMFCSCEERDFYFKYQWDFNKMRDAFVS